MRILLTSPYTIWPANFGGAMRTLNIAKSLAELGHSVILLSRERPGELEVGGKPLEWIGYRGLGTPGHFVNPWFARALSRILARGVDRVIAAFPYQAPMLVPLCRRHQVPLLYDAHNVEADRFASMAQPIKARLIAHTEQLMCRSAHSVLTVSEDDAARFRALHDAVTCQVLPNGMDPSVFHPAATSADSAKPPTALYFGPYDYPPNRQALEFLIHQAWPLVKQRVPTARLLVVGRNPPEWSHDQANVEVLGEVEDIVAAIQQADLLAVPLSAGGGTRLKIIEALACGVPVLSTAIGAMGLAVDDRALETSELPDFAARLAARLARAKADREALADQAVELAGRYSWASSVARIQLD